MGKNPKDISVAFIPTAADPEEDKRFVKSAMDEIKEIGISHGLGDSLQGLRANIFTGAPIVELGFSGTGKGQRGQRPTPESYGKDEREAMRQLSKVNDVRVTTHSSFGAPPLSGFGEGGFNKEVAASSIQELKKAIDFVSKYEPAEIVLACKREAGWKAAKLFGEIFNIRTFTKKYPAGSLTNPNLADFFESELVFICDPWLDKNVLKDANDVKINVMAVCDTNNFTQGIDFITPGNNKSAKSLGMIFYLLAKLYSEKRKIKVEIPPIEEFIEEWATAEIPA